VQHVTVTPFRVVDEINQGMDRINERKVFIQMVEAACRPGTPQCFMFTPKLLPDLPYTYDVMPMTIFNGLHNEELTEDFDDVRILSSLPLTHKCERIVCQWQPSASYSRPTLPCILRRSAHDHLQWRAH